MRRMRIVRGRWESVVRLAMVAVVGWTLCHTNPARAEGEVKTQRIEFNRDVRPILADKCFACHGPDENQRQADLRLDLKNSAVADRGGYRVLVAGKPESSELHQRVTASDPSERMPPEDSGKALSPRDIETLRAWIEQGAEWQKHWSLISLSRPALPQTANQDWSRGQIDDFVVDRLEREDLEPAPRADRRTLIRRLYFDLIGLPPSPSEVEQFASANSEQAYETLVDRLLDAPQYGERMAMHWLDLVRFADTNGIHGDNHRDVWLFRDYIIQSFNENKRFDQFTMEQLAGDLLPEPTRDQRIGSGYNRLLMTTREGGAQPKEYRAKYAADRVRNASSVWLGATLGCAECHDHKFDPYTTKDFYQFAAFFEDIQETAVGVQRPIRVLNAYQKTQLRRVARLTRAVEDVLHTTTPELETAQQDWEINLRDREIGWRVVTPEKAESSGGATLSLDTDGVIRATGASPGSDTYTISFKTDLMEVTAIRLEVLPDVELPNNGPGRAEDGSFALRELTMSADNVAISWSGATATHSQENFPATAAVDGNGNSAWSVPPKTGEAGHAVFELRTDLDVNDATILTLTLVQNQGGQRTLGRFRLSLTDAMRPVSAPGTTHLDAKVVAPLQKKAAARSQEDQDAVAAYFRTVTPLLKESRQRLSALKAEAQQIESNGTPMLVSMSGQPRVTRVLPRGNWLDDSGEIVSPNVPVSLPALETTDSRATRLDLARWFVRSDNPMVARVFVNRLWALLFGEGIVRSLDDFGSQGAWPTHPHLLDWLAMEFIDSGWDVKHMLKLIAMSSTYRQSSVASDALQLRDPFNELLARQGRFRLEAEMVRDNALAISGLLVLKIGGPSVKPYQPAGYWAHLNFPKRTYKHDSGDAQYRRGIYTYWARTFLHPSLLAFDAPSREECAVERPRSNTPQQALVLLNDPTYVEAARVFAQRVLQHDSGDKADSETKRIQFAFREALSRPATAQELSLLSSLLQAHREQYRAESKAALKLLGVGQAIANAGIDPVELAAWTSVTRVILNLHETITRT